MQLKKMSVLFFVLIFFSLPIAVAGEAMQIDHEMHLAHAPSLSEIQAFQPLTSKNVEEGDYNITLEMACRLISANWCHAMNYTGKGIRVAIIEWNDDPNTTTPNDNDNGFYTDNDAPYYDSIELQKDYSDDTPDDVSCINALNAHGTKMATTLNAVAPDAKLILIRVATQDQFIQALDDCSDQGREEDDDVPRVHIVCLGIGYTETNATYIPGSHPISKKVDEVSQKGTIVIVSAGNDNICYDEKKQWFIPTDAKNCITVGAVDENDAHVLSNMGPCGGRMKPDIVAPGYKIIIPVYKNETKFTTVSVSGADFSTALASGATALVLSRMEMGFLRRVFDEDHFPNSQQAAVIKGSLINNAISISKLLPKRDNIYGSGKVDAFLTTYSSEDYESHKNSGTLMYLHGSSIIKSYRCDTGDVIRATLTWMDPVYPEHNVLDMELIDPNDEIICNTSLSVSGNDTDKEIIYKVPSSGRYKLQVRETNIPRRQSQDYGVVISIIKDFSDLRTEVSASAKLKYTVGDYVNVIPTVYNDGGYVSSSVKTTISYPEDAFSLPEGEETHLIGNIPEGCSITNDPWNLRVLKMGEYNISVSTFGTNYDTNLNNNQVSYLISPWATTLSDPSTFAYLDQRPVIHTKLTRMADSLPDKTIKFYCDGNYLGDGITNSTGIATFTLNETLSLGNHSLMAYFPGDGYYKPSENFGTLLILKISTYLSDPSAKCTYSDPLSVSTRLTDYHSNGVEGKTIYFTYDHKKLGDGMTNGEGYAEITMSDCDIKPDNYDLTVEFHGDDRYVESSYSGYLDISKISTSLSNPSTSCRSGKDVTIETCLEDAHGDGVEDKTITFKYYNKSDRDWKKIGEGEDETNRRGDASVDWRCDLPPDRYDLKVKFEGDDYYKGSSCEGRLRVR